MNAELVRRYFRPNPPNQPWTKRIHNGCGLGSRCRQKCLSRHQVEFCDNIISREDPGPPINDRSRIRRLNYQSNIDGKAPRRLPESQPPRAYQPFENEAFTPRVTTPLPPGA